ncbi:MAG: hypothetical protein ACI8W1_002380 [Candidatus Azotimanducaceae bacterium]
MTFYLTNSSKCELVQITDASTRTILLSNVIELKGNKGHILTSMLNLNAISKAEAHRPDVLQFPIHGLVDSDIAKIGNRHYLESEGRKSQLSTLYNKISRFDFTNENWDAGSTAMLYKHYLS